MAKKPAARRKTVVKKAKKTAKRAIATKKRPVAKAKSRVKTKPSRPVARTKAKPKTKAKVAPRRKISPPAKIARPTPKAKVARPRPKKREVNRAVVKKAVAKRVVARRPVARKAVASTVVVKRAVKPASGAAPARKIPSLDRERRVVRESDLPPSPPSSLVPQRHASAASSGADEMRVKLAHHTSAGPVLTAGDVDANWEAAETAGEGAPGGENPTPDQNEVEGIGKALGVQYDDDEELRGGDEIADRDHDRWELDPASSEDFEDR